jgi:hypothetical protein
MLIHDFSIRTAQPCRSAGADLVDGVRGALPGIEADVGILEHDP